MQQKPKYNSKGVLGQRDLLQFTKVTMQSFKPNWFHKAYYKVLDDFARGEIRKLMIFVPPQHGKSEGATRRLPAYLLGKNPDSKIAIVSYSSAKARKFNREIQRIVDSCEYERIFPEVKLSSGKGGYVRTMDELEAVGYNGSIKTIGVGGALTGEPVDILIMDDIYKDARTAWSELVRDGIEDWYNTVAETRTHNNSQQLIVFTRWHEKDLAGYLLSKEAADWRVITYPAIKTGEPTTDDPRKDGEALWPERHSAAKLDAIRKRDPHVFGNLYQQEPKAKQGLLYKQFRTYKSLPVDAIVRKAVIDTADTGEDNLCSIVYATNTSGYYILDVYYTQDGMETTESEAARQLTKYRVNHVRVESNNGGSGYTRNVEKLCRVMGNYLTSFTWYQQRDNKAVRIYAHAAEVQNMVYYPEGWDMLWPQFYHAVTGYMAQGRNRHDDAPDALTMMIENETQKEYLIYTQ